MSGGKAGKRSRYDGGNVKQDKDNEEYVKNGTCKVVPL
jgi:hypothetical protein